MTTLPPDLQSQLEPYIGTTPLAPLPLLSAHILTLPSPLARAVGASIPPRARGQIREIKARRILWATTTPPPPPLRADAGRVRWPLLWERMGGDPTAATSGAQAEAATWARENFMPGQEGYVGRLGRLLAEEEEVREWEEARANRIRERRLDDEGEEFEDSDDDEGEAPNGAGAGVNGTNGHGALPLQLPTTGRGDEDQDAVAAAFERRLLELFIDGLDTIDYDDIDFTDVPDPIRERDDEDRWFDDQTPSGGTPAPVGERAENGPGEYDY